MGGEEIVGARRHARAAGMLALVRTLRGGGVQAMAAIRMGPGHFWFEKEKKKAKVASLRAARARLDHVIFPYALWTATENSRQGASTRSAPRANTLVELRHRVSLCRRPPARSV